MGMAKCLMVGEKGLNCRCAGEKALFPLHNASSSIVVRCDGEWRGDRLAIGSCLGSPLPGEGGQPCFSFSLKGTASIIII